MSARGESKLELDDRQVDILFTNRALAQAEKAMGKSVLAVVNNLASGDAGINDLANLLQAGMEAARRDMHNGGRPVTLNDAFDVLDEAGFADTMTAVVGAVAAVISYSRHSDDEADSGEKNA